MEPSESSTLSIKKEFLEDKPDLMDIQEIKILKHDSTNNFINNSFCSADVKSEFKKDNGDNHISSGNQFHTNETISEKEENITIGNITESSTFSIKEEFEELLEDKPELVHTRKVKILKKDDSSNMKSFMNNLFRSADVKSELKKDNDGKCISPANQFHTNETISEKEENMSIESVENHEIISNRDKKCLLCLRTVDTSDYALFKEMDREILAILLTNIEIKESTSSVICNDCSNMLQEVFAFKSSCLDTEDSLTPFINPQNLGALDISTVFHEIHKAQKSLLPKNATICRFCLEILEKVSFTYLKDLSEADLKMLKKVIPEMQLEATKEPVICEMCLCCFKVCFKFINDCLNALKRYYNSSSISLNDNLDPISFSQNEIKIEENNLVLSETDVENSRYPDVAILDRKGTKKRKKSSLVRHMDLPGCEPRIYKCDKCPYQSKYRRSVYRHRLYMHGTRVFKCDKCSFQTKFKTNIRRHNRIHDEVKFYTCDICQFQTIRKDNLRRHKVKHKKPEEVEMHKCDKCPFQSKYKKSLKQHSVVHEKPEDVKLYECQLCQYTTKYKQQIGRHELVHKDLSELEEVFRCANCDFVTKWKATLKTHMMQHMNVFNKCEFCNFKSLHGKDMSDHLKRIHKEKIKLELTNT